MDHLSRRDAVYEQLGVLRDALRPLEQPTSAPPSTSTDERATTSSASSMSGIAQANENLNRYLDRVSSNLQSGRLNATNLNPPDSPSIQSNYSAMGRLSATSSQISLELPHESLPVYAPAESPQPVKYLHSLTSPSRKVQLFIESIGSKGHPVYVQGVCTTVAGKLRLRLQGDQNVTEVRIRVKGMELSRNPQDEIEVLEAGVAITSVTRSHQSAAKTVIEEGKWHAEPSLALTISTDSTSDEFWYAGALLWSGSPQQLTLDSNKEVYEYPFSLDIASQVASSQKVRKPCTSCSSDV